jgi:hypothetical protein
MLRPVGDKYARRLRTSCFALPGEVSLYQADYVSLKEPIYSIYAGNATPTFSLIKFMSLVRSISRK